MCVIMVYKDKRFPLKKLEQAARVNRDGAGIAWIQGGAVHYRKGLTAKEVHALSCSVPFPQVIHFRQSTVGGYDKKLTHPFPISDQVELTLRGKTQRVLFHNGHWREWEDRFRALQKRPWLPTGTYSDSRLIAAMAYIMGSQAKNLYNHIGDKFAVLDVEKGVERYGLGWEKVDGITCSNSYWSWPGYEYGEFQRFKPYDDESDYGGGCWDGMSWKYK